MKNVTVANYVPKMFKAAMYVKKHIETKHAEPVVNPIKRKALENQFYSNYLNDSYRILPSLQYISLKQRSELRKSVEQRQMEEKSPLDHSPRSPRRYDQSPYDRSPRRRSRSRSWERDRSRERSRSRGKKNSWSDRGSGGRGFRGGRGGGRENRFFRSNRPRIDYTGRDQQDYLEKSDPRPSISYSDLDLVPTENFEVDYESVLTLFRKSSNV